MFSLRRLWLLSAAAALVLALALSSFAEARPGSVAEPEGEGEMTDALKYLEELDKYYSQVARPR